MPERHPGLTDSPKPRGRARKASTDNDTTPKDNTPSAAAETATSDPAQGRASTSEDNTTITMTDPAPVEPTRAQKSRQVLAEEQAELTKASALHDHHTSAAAELDAFLVSGRASLVDLGVYIDQQKHTQAAVAVTAKLVEGFKGNVGRATAALVNDDARIADLIADVLTDMLGDYVNVNVVTEGRDVQAPTDPRQSVAFVLQDKPSHDRGGALSGNVLITYYRAKTLAALDGQEVERLCRASGYDLDVSVTGYSGGPNGQSYEVARVVVRKAFAPMPVLAEAPTQEAVRELAQAIGSRLVDAVRYRGERVGIRLMGDPVEVGASADVGRVQIEGIQQDDAKSERMTVAVSFGVTPSKDLAANEVTALRDAMERCVGIAEAGTGRVASVENVQTSWVEKRPLPPGTVAEGYGRPLFNVTATLILAYRIA